MYNVAFMSIFCIFLNLKKMKKVLFAIFGLTVMMLVSCTDQSEDVYNDMPVLKADMADVSADDDPLVRPPLED